MRSQIPVIFELSRAGRSGCSFPECDVAQKPAAELIPSGMLRKSPAALPEISEVDTVRHYTALSRRNIGVDNTFYPLGSCTMKYNPKINEDIARMAEFSSIHPYQPEETVQGALEIMYRLSSSLCEITGMDEVTLQPAAGAHGELTGLMIIKAYLQSIGETKRNKIIIPDSAHGTNPASASVAGFETVEIKSGPDGEVDVDALKQALGDDTAGLMLTNPNTLGLFETRIAEIARLTHEAGGLVYYDGANLNAIMGIARPGDMGFDVVHLNLHKTFSTPHGCGGPGSGPVGVKARLAPFLPKPAVIRKPDGKYSLDYDLPLSIGKVKAFYGNFGVCLRAFVYILSLGGIGLKEASENAVLNANYLLNKLRSVYPVPFDFTCMHEFVISPVNLNEYGIHTSDIAKALIDRGVHPPTIYFPMIVKEAMMIEPTETESRETLDDFAGMLSDIAIKARTEPDSIICAPLNTVIGRPDEVAAARKPVIRWPLR